MAFIIVPEPGSRLGPCLDACQHKDCAMHRATATEACHFCAKPIGYETPYGTHGWSQSVAHWECIMKDQESR